MTKFLMIAALGLSSLGFVDTASAQQRCRNCGIVEDVDRYREDGGDRGDRTGRTVLGAVVGGVLGSQVGSGRGRTAATVAGAVAGGAIARNAGRDRGSDRTVYEFRVRMNRGGRRTFTQYGNPDRIGRGDWVIVRDGYVRAY